MSNFLTSNQLKGVFNVVSIPLNDEDQIDQSVLKKEIDWLIKCGCDGLVLAMVSEVLRFSAQERRVMWQKTLEYLQGRKPLVVSVGAESSAIAVELAKQAAFDGAAAVMATRLVHLNQQQVRLKNIINQLLKPLIFQQLCKMPVII